MALGIAHQDDELLLGPRGHVFAGLGLDSEVHFLDHPAQNRRGSIVFFFRISATLLTSIFAINHRTLDRVIQKNTENFKMDEYFDIVDEQDRVIGRATPRGVLTRRGCATGRSMCSSLTPPAGCFLQKRSDDKRRRSGSLGLSCSGHVDSGEDYDAAATRELSEELGLEMAAPPALVPAGLLT